MDINEVVGFGMFFFLFFSFVVFKVNEEKQRKRKMQHASKKLKGTKEFRYNHLEHNKRLLARQLDNSDDLVARIMYRSIDVIPQRELRTNVQESEKGTVISWTDWIRNNRELDDLRTRVSLRKSS